MNRFPSPRVVCKTTPLGVVQVVSDFDTRSIPGTTTGKEGSDMFKGRKPSIPYSHPVYTGGPRRPRVTDYASLCSELTHNAR